MLYSQNDIILNKKTKNKKLTVLLLITIILLSAIIVSFIVRQKTITIGLTIILGFFLTTYIGLIYIPVKRYERQLYEILNGRKRETSGFIKSIDDELLVREGIDCYQIIVKIGEDKSGDEDIILYLDGKKYFENINVGDPVKFLAFDRFIYSYEKLDSLIIPTLK